MRWTKLLIMIFIIMFILIACTSSKILYKEGTFEGVGQGHHGIIKVLVTTDSYRIKKIEIIEEQEVPVISDIVYEKIPPKVIRKNSAEVDVVAGATLTSNGLLESIRDALNKARNK